MVGAADLLPGRCDHHRPDQPDGDQGADPGRPGRSQMRHFSGGADHHHWRLDEDL